MKFNKLEINQADSKFKEWTGVAASPPPLRGWLNLVRVVLGMTTYQLAKRMGLSQGRVVQIESAESRGATTLNTLRQAAEAMGCQLVYAVVPKTSLKDVLKEQATRLAKQQMESVSHTMALEGQAVDPKTQEKQLKELIQELLDGPTKKLWKE